MLQPEMIQPKMSKEFMHCHLETPHVVHGQTQMKRKQCACLCYLMMICSHFHFLQPLSSAEAGADFAESIFIFPTKSLLVSTALG